MDFNKVNYPCFLMSPPFFLDSGSPNNVFMQELSPTERKIDKSIALRQFLDFYNFLSSISLVYLLPSYAGLQDQPFVANLGVVLPHLPEYTVVVANFRSPPRQGETRPGFEFLKMLGIKDVVDLAPKYFEGEADCKYLGGNNYAMSYGMRTNAAAIRWFEETYNMNIIGIRLKNPEAYHLDCVLFPLTKEKTVVAIGEIDAKELKELEKVTEVISAPSELVAAGATNCLRVRRLVVVGSSISKLKISDDKYKVERDLVDFVGKFAADNSMDSVVFNISEFGKSGAALSCLVMHLNYFDFQPGRSEDG
jgi:N-dimethylarginine dimethylaminohydrolase